MRHFLSCVVGTLLLYPSISIASPELCDDIHLDATGGPVLDSQGMTLSRFCEWTNIGDVVVWDDDVCCLIGTSSITCTPTDSMGRCVTGAKFHCDYAIEVSGVVTCQQPWADACAQGYCSTVLPSGAVPMGNSEPLCCVDVDDCVVVDIDNPVACGGDYLLCDSPFTNGDGSVGCSDDE